MTNLTSSARGTWAEASARLGRNDMPAALIHAVSDEFITDPSEIAKGIRDAWTMAEWPTQAADDELWMAMFDAALGPDEYLREAAPAPVAELPEVVTLWRGATEEHALGMSWTDDRERALWFATRFSRMRGSSAGDLYQADIHRGVVLARFHESRGENEWVIDIGQVDPCEIEIVG